MENSIRYDVSLGMRLLRAIPVVGVYFGLALLIFLFLPDRARAIPLESIAVLGFIGMWRYLWLLTHCVRAALYEYVVYPKLQFRASQLSESEKYPSRLYFLIPTFKEKPQVTRSMFNSVLNEVGQVPSQITVFVNAGSESEDQIFREIHQAHPAAGDVTLEFVRQSGGKRQGMADCLYALSDLPVDDSDIVVLMDGDTVLGKGISAEVFASVRTATQS